jgi:hypothetical protein
MPPDQPPTNVTIKVDQFLLLCARVRALQYGTSVNRVLNDALRELAHRPRPAHFVPSEEPDPECSTS